MALSALRLWVHHRTLPIDARPDDSVVIDLGEVRSHQHLEEAERVAT